MREIKFRAWDKMNNKMIEPVIPLGAGLMSINKIFLVYKDLDWMQFTGLNDKNGKEIYEGDIIHYYVKSKKKDSWEIKEVYNKKELVSWGVWYDDEYGYEIQTWLLGDYYLSEYTKYKNKYWDALDERYEVIGNIYENPELIE